MKPMKPMAPIKPMAPMKPMKAPERWWPEELGQSPNSAGGQNGARYAFFAGMRRLALDSGDGNVLVYDTGNHSISGVQQAQGGGRGTVVFTSQHGQVGLGDLKRV
jgi:hypothetical protein